MAILSADDSAAIFNADVDIAYPSTKQTYTTATVTANSVRPTANTSLTNATANAARPTAAYTPVYPGYSEPPEEQAANAMLNSGLNITNVPELIFDGKIHRFDPDGKSRTDVPGWYVFHPADSNISVPAGAFGNWRASDNAVTWCGKKDDGSELSAADRAAIKKIQEEIRARDNSKRQKERAAAALKARDIFWCKSIPANNNHPYLVRKKVKAHDLHDDGQGNLVVPVYDESNKLVSLQYIASDGGKYFLSGGAVMGNFSRIEGDSKTVYMCEGYATGASVHESTGSTAIVALNAGNLVNVAPAVKRLYPSSDIVVVADNDDPSKGESRGVGELKAREAASKINAKLVVIPRVNGHKADANDYAVAYGPKKLKEVLLTATPVKKRWMHSAVDYRNRVSRPVWLIKNVVKRSELHMIYGEAGCGKSFVMLSLAMAIACERKKDWFGQPILNHGPVIYLAGEGFDGIVDRLEGAFQEEEKEGFKREEFRNLFISEQGKKVDDLAHREEIIQEINQCIADCGGEKPVLIIIDTLQNAYSGDENSVQDTNKMIDSCQYLSRLYDKCGIFIVHHKGKSKDSLGPRGSSAWNGILNISFFCQKDGDYIAFATDAKHKDNKSIKKNFALTEVPIEGVFDDDGEQATTCVLTWDGMGSLKEETSGPKLSDPQHNFLNLFCTTLEKQGFVDRDNPDLMCVLYSDFYDAFKEYRLRMGKSDVTEKAHRNAFNRAFEALAEKKHILECNGDYCNRIIRFTQEYFKTDAGTYYNMTAYDKYRKRRVEIEGKAARLNFDGQTYDNLYEYYKATGRYKEIEPHDETDTGGASDGGGVSGVESSAKEECGTGDVTGGASSNESDTKEKFNTSGESDVELSIEFGDEPDAKEKNGIGCEPDASADETP